MSARKNSDRYVDLRESLLTLPHISEPQVDQWVELQKTIDSSRDYLIRAVPQAQESVDESDGVELRERESGERVQGCE